MKEKDSISNNIKPIKIILEKIYKIFNENIKDPKIKISLTSIINFLKLIYFFAQKVFFFFFVLKKEKKNFLRKL